MYFQFMNEFVQIMNKFENFNVSNYIRANGLFLNQLNLILKQIVFRKIREMNDDMFYFYDIFAFDANDYTSLRKHDQMFIHSLQSLMKNKMT